MFRFSLKGRLVRFDWLKREPLISIKKEPGTRIASRLSMVAEMVGFEPTCPSLDKTISSRSRYDHFDSPPYILTVFCALRKCKKNRQERYEILKLELVKTLVPQGFPAEETARVNAHFESASLRPLRYISIPLRRVIISDCWGKIKTGRNLFYFI